MVDRLWVHRHHPEQPGVSGEEAGGDQGKDNDSGEQLLEQTKKRHRYHLMNTSPTR